VVPDASTGDGKPTMIPGGHSVAALLGKAVAQGGGIDQFGAGEGRNIGS
jgi:hypothetical protein